MYRPNAHHDDSRAILAEIKSEADGYDPEPETHYHVTANIPGCLNDTNDGPYLDIESAREAAAELAATYYGDDTYAEETGNRFEWFAHRNKKRYEQGYSQPYRIAVEECTEPACLDLDYEPF
jgi:hypothetical protein